MLKRFIIPVYMLSSISTGALASDLVIKQSDYNVATTLDRLEKIVNAKGIAVIARVNHGAAANKAGIELRPTELLIFGNPKLGSPLMLQNQKIGIDLPMKVLAWEDEQGRTWVAYNQPEYFFRRHGVKQDGIQKKMTGALDKLTAEAIAKT